MGVLVPGVRDIHGPPFRAARNAGVFDRDIEAASEQDARKERDEPARMVKPAGRRARCASGRCQEHGGKADRASG